jgi:putative phage-type endonuclease
MTATILNLVQGTPDWHAHRAKSRNASETPIVLGVSPFMSPQQLWRLKTGRAKPRVNAAMQHGTDLEPAARARYEELTGQIMQPLVLQDGAYSASLDGITVDGETILEVKCPYRGRNSALWKSIEDGTLPIHYEWQVQHQLMVSGAQAAHVWVYDGSIGLLHEVNPMNSNWPRIWEAWDQFEAAVASDTPEAHWRMRKAA